MQNIKRKNKAEGGGQTAQKGIAMKFETIDNRELDLAVIINVPSGEVLDTFLESHGFFEKVEVLE